MREKQNSKTYPLIVGMTVLGALGVSLCAFGGPDVRVRFFANWVLWLVMLLSLFLGSLFLVTLEHLVSARWSVPLRKVPERLASVLWLVVPVALIALFGIHDLYLWARPEALQDIILTKKALWLNYPFFCLRVVICLALWALFYYLLVGGSKKQELGLAPKFKVRAKRLAPVCMIVFAITVSVAAFDWIMSLEPHWFSTMIGVYLFSGSVVCGLAATTLLTVYLMGKGRLPGIKTDHLYNLGALQFAFTAFWAYIAFSQFMLIWYANLPEENVFFIHRFHGGWLGVSILLPVIHFFIPFFALLARDAKSNVTRLTWVSILLLVSHLVDMYWYIFPTLDAQILFGWQELSFALFFVGLALLWVRHILKRGADMPTNDPLLEEGLSFSLQEI
ncbi:quinol:cytochrome C oxidoreductase [Oligoflexia bacterium]|nr:quinol:cytochrome C oxidoreductase [Oligoflexia bacterium]